MNTIASGDGDGAGEVRVTDSSVREIDGAEVECVNVHELGYENENDE